MKYLLIIISLVLSGCSTMSEYQAGCYDALDQAFNVEENPAVSKEQNDEFKNNMEYIKVQTCRELNAKKRMRYDNK